MASRQLIWALALVPGLASFSPGKWTVVVERDRDGQVIKRSEFRQDLRDSVVDAWYPNGRQWYHRTSQEGREVGEHRGWWENGELHFVYHYRRGMIEGAAREWFPSGALYREFHYEAGHESGSEKMWYADGKLRASCCREKQSTLRPPRNQGMHRPRQRRGGAMRQILAGVVAVTIVVAMLGAKRRPVETLPFYQSGDKTPEWIAPGSEAYAQIHHVADFKLIDQDGPAVTQATVAGKIYVASFFFTTCRQLCPKLQSNLAKVQAAFRDDSNVLILSHTVAPETDDSAMLRRYASVNGIISGKWHLLTGPAVEIGRLARDSYFAQPPGSADGTPSPLLHSETLILVDQLGRVRGLYDGSVMFDVERLIEDIHTLR